MNELYNLKKGNSSMSTLLLDKYYDITCERCTRTRSQDYSKGMCKNKKNLIELAQDEGWRVISDHNVCPVCAKLLNDKRWKEIVVQEPPVDHSKNGIDSRTEKKYIVLTKEGHVETGYIYKNQYSCSGYAVWIGEDYYYNNVTHWIPE